MDLTARKEKCIGGSFQKMASRHDTSQHGIFAYRVMCLRCCMTISFYVTHLLSTNAYAPHEIIQTHHHALCDIASHIITKKYKNIFF
jgi:hypothetical protein